MGVFCFHSAFAFFKLLISSRTFGILNLELITMMINHENLNHKVYSKTIVLKTECTSKCLRCATLTNEYIFGASSLVITWANKNMTIFIWKSIESFEIFQRIIKWIIQSSSIFLFRKNIFEPKISLHMLTLSYRFQLMVQSYFGNYDITTEMEIGRCSRCRAGQNGTFCQNDCKKCKHCLENYLISVNQCSLSSFCLTSGISLWKNKNKKLQILVIVDSFEVFLQYYLPVRGLKSIRWMKLMFR